MGTYSTVNWSDHQAFLYRGLNDLYVSGRYADLEIKCYDHVFKVHKLVMSLFTDFFLDCDGLWMRINLNPEQMEKVIIGFYYTD